VSLHDGAAHAAFQQRCKRVPMRAV